jgi:uncharacterized protein (TIGR02246 family)
MPTSQDALIDLSHELVRAIAGRNASALANILHDDFVHLASSDEPSSPQDKEAFINAIATAPYEIVDISLSALRVRFADDIAVVVGIQKAQVQLENQDKLTSAGSFTDVFRRVDGRWRLWLAHSTELPAC